LDRRLAPVKVAVLPLSRNPDLSPKARDVAAQVRRRWNAEFDDASGIGRRYRRQDEIGTPYCVTVDFDSLSDQAVTVRERDSMRPDRIAIDKLVGYLADRLAGCCLTSRCQWPLAGQGLHTPKCAERHSAHARAKWQRLCACVEH